MSRDWSQPVDVPVGITKTYEPRKRVRRHAMTNNTTEHGDISYALLDSRKTDLRVFLRGNNVGTVIIAPNGADGWVFQTPEKGDARRCRYGWCKTQQEAIANLVLIHSGGMPTVDTHKAVDASAVPEIF